MRRPQVLAFYERLGMPLPERVPLMLVDGPALNEAGTREGARPGGPAFHTRGLTLCQVRARCRAGGRPGCPRPAWVAREFEHFVTSMLG